MSEGRGTLRAGRGSPACLGVISGYVLKVVRESVGLTQAAFAELAGVDVTTVQGWESGRRSLTAVRAADLTRLRALLVARGAPLPVFDLLRDAVEADLVVADAVAAGGKHRPVSTHLLGGHVHRRNLNSLITWPFTGDPPDLLTELAAKASVPRRGPVADRPQLGAEERRRFFDHMQVMADSCRSEETSLLRRQAIFLLGYDDRPAVARWLREEQAAVLRSARRPASVAEWVALRSAAVTAAHHGDGEVLREFVRHGLVEDKHEQANLAYWAYWVGEIAEVQGSDGFLAAPVDTWSGAKLFEHLVDRLTPGSRNLALNVHTLWSLVLARPEVARLRPDYRLVCLQTITDAREHTGSDPQTQEELAGVAYAVKLAAR